MAIDRLERSANSRSPTPSKRLYFVRFDQAIEGCQTSPHGLVEASGEALERVSASNVEERAVDRRTGDSITAHVLGGVEAPNEVQPTGELSRSTSASMNGGGLDVARGQITWTTETVKDGGTQMACGSASFEREEVQLAPPGRGLPRKSVHTMRNRLEQAGGRKVLNTVPAEVELTQLLDGDVAVRFLNGVNQATPVPRSFPAPMIACHHTGKFKRT